MGIQQLYTPPATPEQGKHVDRAFVLKRLAKSLLLNFLELAGVMGVNPEQVCLFCLIYGFGKAWVDGWMDANAREIQYREKIEDLRTLLINFHHLLNEYRPHQARESLILMMQDQLERSRAETEEIRGMKERVEGIIEGLSQAKLGEGGEEMKGVEKGDVVEEGKDVWEELEREFS